MGLTPERIDLAQVAAQAPVGWAVLDVDGSYVMGNVAFAGLFGRTVEGMTRVHLSELTSAGSRKATDDLLAPLVGGEIDRLESDQECIHAGTGAFTARLAASLLRDAAGDPVGLIAVVEDVSNERDAVARLALSEVRLSKMLTNISDTLTLVDREGRVTATTGFVKEILGYPPDFWRSATVFDLVHPDDAETATRLAASVLTRRGVEQRGELRVAHAAGHYETVELTAVNLLEDPSVEAVVITSRNVTERKEAERELTAIRDSALALADQRAAFVASVSHELRTPVHAVLGLTELLTERVRGSEDAELVAGIRREAERLQSTVDDLLEHSRFEAQGITLRVMPVDVSALVARVVQRAAATSYGAKLTITSAIGPGMPTYVAADEHRLEQVLTNLVANAVKFTAAGEVRLAASWSPDGSLAFEVADTGPGIPASHRELIFEPFVQVPDVAGATGGSGLGLALVRGLLSAMGGTVALDCPPEGGSVFRVEVPAPAAEGPADIAPPPGPDPGSRGVSVLVVEDNEVNQQLAREQLLRLGHRATVVGLATEALAILAAPDHDHDIVLMDWQLPELDGVEATRLLRAAEAGDGRRRVPVIAMTASALPDDRAHCRDAGMDDFLPKPVSLRDLKTMIDKWAPTVADTRSPDVPRAGADRFDASALETLVSDLDDRPAVMSLVSRYLVELDERERELRESAAAGEIERVRRVSHTLRSTSEMMGALGLGDLCRALEASTPEDDLEATMSRFTDAAARARSQLQHWIDEHETPS